MAPFAAPGTLLIGSLGFPQGSAHRIAACVLALIVALAQCWFRGLAFPSDNTLAELDRAFGLVRTERVPRADLPSAPVLGVYSTRSDPRLVVVDQVNGGKADSLKAVCATRGRPCSAASTRTRCSTATR
jgi:hypothetical protein